MKKNTEETANKLFCVYLCVLFYVGGIFPMGASGVQCSDDGCDDPLGDADWDSICSCVLLSRLCISSHGRSKADPHAGSAVQIAA